ncbi:hypothetical protein AB0F36_09290 [Streptomyces sp. NPDC029080]|uniref:hypothetical protein n=1 Tax=Streptomyces sp. NPDC029080 TaxID=3155017 RepID=UPI0034037075
MDDIPRKGPVPLLRFLTDFLTGPEMVAAVLACWPTVAMPTASRIQDTTPDTATDTEEADHE